MIAHSIRMPELADYLSGPLDAALTDETGLSGRYGFTIDFSKYVEEMHTADTRPDPVAVIRAALKGSLGLDLIQHKEEVPTLVVDQVELPSSN